MAEQTMCMNCGENPAQPGKSTVPLCPQCGAFARGKERGVKLAPKQPQKNKKLSAVR